MEENRKTESATSLCSENSDLNPNSSVMKQAKNLLGKSISQLVQINTKLGNYEEALTLSKEATKLLKDWPYAYVDHMKIESDLYNSQEELYLALESIDKALKTCDLEGLDIRKISLLRAKLDLLKLNKPNAVL